MLDFTQTNPKMTATWRDHIAHGDIVSFRFPLAEEGAEDRPKARPCLVLDIQQIGDRRYALLAYGTNSRRPSNVGYEVHARKRAEYLSAGLNEPTKFVGRRRVLVPLTHHGFVICTAIATPVLGSLDGAPFKRLNAVRGRIHAERDIAAERRRDRRSLRTSPPHSAVHGTDFSAEQCSPEQCIIGAEVQG